ncbi:MAG TPA: ABC transporter ATP-binding protein [Candidatus Acidoferrum sp.]|nr:ABC transporter ATP-binding protein [Candidatus Acidoferrum sp.]
MMDSVTSSTATPGGRLISFALKHWRLALLQVSLAIAGTLLMPVFPNITQRFFDDIIPNQRLDQVLPAALLMFGAFAAIELLFYFRTRVNSTFEQTMIFDLRGQLHRKIARMQLNWFDRQSTGDLLTRMAEDVPAAQRVILEGIEQGMTALLQIVMAIVVMFHTNTALTWIVLIPTPFIAAGGWIYARLLAPRETQARVATGRMHSLLFDTIAGIRQLKSFTYEEAQQQRFNRTSRNLQKVQKRLMAAAALYSPLMSLLGKVGQALVVVIGASWAIAGNAAHPLSAGQLLAFVLLVNMLYEPIARLHGVNQMMVTGLASATRVFAVLDDADEEDLETGDEARTIAGEFELRGVSFGYKPDRLVLNNIDLTVKPCQTVALVGASGSGKSTIFQLLTAFYAANAGAILLDGQPLAAYSKRHLRQAMAYVTQDSFMFATSIRDNLKLGKPGASDEELWQALALASAGEFVKRLPQGLDTPVGERGSALSGGERQRLAIARAFLKNAPILLLDEATSAVDNKSEKLIQAALKNLRQNRTCLVIAHRLSTVVDADCLYVMRNGEVLASGTHYELLRTNAYYAELAKIAFDDSQR